MRKPLQAALLLVGMYASAVWGASPEEEDMPPQIRAIMTQAAALEHGEGVPRDAVGAISLYCRAARMGELQALFSLGWIYANGRGVPRDDAAAAHYFALAAQRGHAQAERMLAQTGSPAGRAPACLRPESRTVEYEASGGPSHVASSAAQRKVAGWVHQLAPQYAVAPELALAVIAAESNFDPSARSPRNAQGLMQLIPETAVRFNVRDVWDPLQNLRGGLSYLRWLLAYFRGNVTLAVAAYNAGEGAVDRYRGVPPYRETRDYVKRVMSQFQHASHHFNPAVTAAAPWLTRSEGEGR